MTSVLVDRYELRARIGSGGMATVWRAFDRRLGREVAVKVLSEALATDDRFRNRFEREAHHIASLSDPNIVVVHDFGIDGDQLFIVMELVKGKTLRQLLAESAPLAPPVVAQLAADVLAGLGHAHERDILHRDIKPGNILITESGSSKLADFGIAKATEETVDLTDSGAILGTVSYASPEQLSGRPLGPPSDLYSLGCVLYECVAGRPPFVADNLVALLSQQQFAAPDPLVGLSPEVPPELGDTIMRALEKDPAKRFASAREMREALEADGQIVINRPPVVSGKRAALPPRLSVVAPFGFVGRYIEHEALTTAWKDVVAGGRRAVLLSGEPGIGKTTFAAEFIRHAYAEGALVLYGRCDEDLGIPYQPWVEVFSFLVDHVNEQLVEAVGSRISELGALVPNLRESDRSLDVDLESERFVLFAAVADALHDLGESQPLCILLDDLHWADRPTLLMLRHLLGATRASRMLVIGTFRDSEIDEKHALPDLLASLHSNPEARRIALSGLAGNEVVALLEAAAGHELPDEAVELAHSLWRETNGNPFFAIEIIRHLAETGLIFRDERGKWASRDDRLQHALPVSVREVVGRRVARLGDETSRILRVASVIGREFDVELLAEITELEGDSLVDQLEAAVEADLVRDIAPGHFTFVHALVEHTLYESLSLTRRARLHRRIAEAIEELGTDGHIAELAYHWGEAMITQDPGKAIHYARRVGDHALEVLAPDEARRWYARALELADAASPDPSLRCDLLIELGEAQRQASDPTYRTTLFEAAQIADAIGDTDRLVRGALANGRLISMYSRFGDVDQERVEVLRHALDALGDSDAARRARLLARLAAELTYAERPAERKAIADEALATATECRDDATLLAVLLARDATIAEPSETDERLQAGKAALTLAEQRKDPIAVFGACKILYDAAWPIGDLELADNMLSRLVEISAQLDQPELRWPTLAREAERCLVAGDLDQAETVANAALQAGVESGQPDALVRFIALFGPVQLMRGRLGELVDDWEEIFATIASVPLQDAGLALARSAGGRTSDAAVDLTVHREGFATIERDEQWTCTLAIWARVACAVNDRVAAEALFDLLIPWRHLYATTGVSVTGPVSLYLGMLARVLERDDASELLAEAIRAAERIEDPHHGGEARINLARQIGTTERSRAWALLDEASERIKGRGYHGLDADLAQARAEMTA